MKILIYAMSLGLVLTGHFSQARPGSTPPSGVACAKGSFINQKEIKESCRQELTRKVETEACFFGDSHHVANLIHGMKFDLEKIEMIAEAKSNEPEDLISYRYVNMESLPAQTFELRRCPSPR